MEELTTLQFALNIMIWGFVSGWIAHRKGHDNLLWFVFGGMTSWIGMIALLVFLPIRDSNGSSKK